MSRFTDYFFRLERREDVTTPGDPGTGTAEGTVIPGRAIDARTVTTKDALGQGHVYRAASIISTSVRQLTLDAWRGTTRLDPAPALIRQPNTDDSLADFLEETTLNLALSGNAFWLIDRDPQGRIINLTVLNAQDVQPDQLTNWGRVNGWQYRGEKFATDRIKHLKLMRVPGEWKGLGPIQAAQSELRGSLDTRDYAANWFSNGTPAEGYWTTDQMLNSDMAGKYKDALTKAANDRTSKPVVGNGLHFQQLFLSPADALWIETRNFDVTSAARLFGVPSTLMLAPTPGSKNTYTNYQQELTGYVRFGLMQYLSKIEDAFSSLLPRGTMTRFNVEGLLRADTTTRYAAYESGIRAGWLLKSEVRETEGIKPVRGIDKPSAPVAPPSPSADADTSPTPNEDTPDE